MTTEPILLKTDTRLRVQTPPAQRDALLDLFATSTSTAKAFAAEHGIKYPTFMVWIQKRKLVPRDENVGGGGPISSSTAPTAPAAPFLQRSSASTGEVKWLEGLFSSPGMTPFSQPQPTSGSAVPAFAGSAARGAGLWVELPHARVLLQDHSQVALVAALLSALASSSKSNG